MQSHTCNRWLFHLLVSHSEGRGAPGKGHVLFVPTVTQLCPCSCPLSLSEVFHAINPSDRPLVLRVSLLRRCPALPGCLSWGTSFRSLSTPSVSRLEAGLPAGCQVCRCVCTSQAQPGL